MAHEHKQETFLLEKDQTIITREESTLYENIYSPLKQLLISKLLKFKAVITM